MKDKVFLQFSAVSDAVTLDGKRKTIIAFSYALGFGVKKKIHGFEDILKALDIEVLAESRHCRWCSENNLSLTEGTEARSKNLREGMASFLVLRRS